MQVNIAVHHLLLTVEYFSVFKLFFLYYGHFRSYFFDHASLIVNCTAHVQCLYFYIKLECHIMPEVILISCKIEQNSIMNDHQQYPAWSA